MVDGKCVTAVSNCAIQNQLGICSKCNGPYQLIGNACIPLPSNCNTVDAAGKCTDCKVGFVVNNGVCVIAAQNTCPAGTVPVNG